MPINLSIEYPKLKDEVTKLRYQNEELVNALQNILKNWDENIGVQDGLGIETHKSFPIEGKEYSYWSPASAMVSSEFINAARLALQKVNANT